MAELIALAERGALTPDAAVPLEALRGRTVVVYVDATVRGGTATYGSRVAAGLRRRGLRVAAICSTAEALEPVRRELADADVAVHAIDDGGTSVAGRLRAARAFARVIRMYPDCLLALMMGYFTPGAAIIAAGRFGGATAIVRADLQPPMPPISGWSRLAIRAKDRFVDRIVVGAIENKEAYVRLTGRRAAKIEVVHTGIDLDQFVPGSDRDAARAELGLAANTLAIGTLSRLEEDRKGIAEFIRMAASIAGGFPDARFVIAGDGWQRAAFERLAADLGIADRVRFTGWRADRARILAALDVFVMPSLFEGGPTTVLEAMAMGLPVVATNVGMVPEVVDDGKTGLVVPPGDVHALTTAVRELAARPETRTRLAEAARTAAVARFGTDRMVDGYVAVLAGTARRSAARAAR
jgi:glycosyltransferase involved in cell wall biosynthesis